MDELDNISNKVNSNTRIVEILQAKIMSTVV